MSLSLSATTAATILRPYQQECINRTLDLFKKNLLKSQVISLPVGSGKTVIISHLIQKLQQSQKSSSKVLILSHRRELLLQTKRQINSSFPSLKVSIEAGDDRCNQISDVVIASVHSIGSIKGSTRLHSSFNPLSYKAILIDEAHHSVAPIYKRVIDFFRSNNKNILIWGCSATIARNDGRSLSSIYQHVTYHLPLPKLIENNTICTPIIKSFQSSFDPLTIATGWMNNIYGTSRKSTLIFALNIQQCSLIRSALLSLEGSPLLFKDVEIITSKTIMKERERILDSFSKGNLSILINCSILCEGIDIPRTDSIIIQRPSCSNNLFLQIIGRGLRKWGGDKKDCLILDYSSLNRNLSSNPLLDGGKKGVPENPGHGFNWKLVFCGDLSLDFYNISVFVIPTSKINLLVYLKMKGNSMYGMMSHNDMKWIPFPLLIKELYRYGIRRDILIEMKMGETRNIL